ncbi:MAG: N-acetyltransferase family protein [Draconibacterium sp.]|jgi:phosphinothricin acetyltransferase
MNITFKEISENSLPEVKKIYDWYIKNSTATFHTEPIEIDQLKDFIYFNHQLYKSYFIYGNNEIGGYCILTNYKKRQAYDRTAEVTIYLKPEFCGKGLGKRALAYLEEKARENGLKNLIGVITGDNSGSIALFEKSGFEKCAHFKNVGEKFNNVLDVVAFQKEI